MTQPVNTVSSLAYVAAGADLLRRREADRPFAWAVICVGLGSVALHGPGGRLGKWAHDASLLAMLGLMAASDLTVAEGQPLPDALVPAVVAASVAAANPVTSDVAQGMVGAVAVAAAGRRLIRHGGWRELFVGLPLWTGGITMHVLGRTGERWCRPDSLLQPHAAWHTLSAAALWNRRRF